MRFFTAQAVLLCGILSFSAPLSAQTIGTESGKPLPRFESLRFDTVRMRHGPGREHTIAWLYQRKGMPIEVFKEYGDWRQVRDAVGDTGWINRSQLSSARYGLVEEAGAPLFRSADKESRIVAKAEAGVVLKLRECSLNWCRGSARGYAGWIEKTALWGVFAAEKFDGD